jgi:hypothetical protein
VASQALLDGLLRRPDASANSVPRPAKRRAQVEPETRRRAAGRRSSRGYLGRACRRLGAGANVRRASATRSPPPGEKNRFAFLKSAAERERLGWTVKRNMQTARSEPSWSTTTLGFQERGGGGRRVLTPGMTTPPHVPGTGWPRGTWVTRTHSAGRAPGGEPKTCPPCASSPPCTLHEFASVQNHQTMCNPKKLVTRPEKWGLHPTYPRIAARAL